MEVSFSHKPRTAVSLPPSCSPSRFHLPTSIRRELLGCGTHLRPLGLRSRRRCSRPRARIPSPRSALQDFQFEGSILAVAAVAILAALQVIYINYSRWRRRSHQVSDEEVPNVMFSGGFCTNDAKIMEHETVQNQFFGSESLHTGSILYKGNNIVDEGTHEYVRSSEVHAYDIKDAHLSKIQTSALVHEVNKLRPETEVLSCLSVIAHEVDVRVTQRVEAVAVANVTGIVIEPTLGCFAISVKKQIEANQDNELDHITVEGGFVSANRKLRTHFLKVSAYKIGKQPGVSPISCFKSSNTEPSYHTIQDKVGSYTRLRPALKLGEESVRAHDLSNMRSFMLNTDDRNFPGSCQSNGRIVKGASDPSGYLRTYTLLLRHTRLKDCVDLLESMDGKGSLDMDKVHHTRFLKACKSRKAVNEAFRFCKLIKNPTLSTFNMLLSICAISQDFDGAFQVMLLVKVAGLKPDCILYTTLISTCAKCGRVDAMFEVFHEMVNAGVEPNVNTYGALIDGCARAGQVAKAFGAYGIMRSKKVQPDRVIFNALITACGQSGAVDRAFDVLAEMMAEPKPIDPDHVTIGALMKTCTQAGQVDRVREVYKMLHLYNLKGTPEVYTIAVRSCSTAGDLAFALSIYDDMKRNGVVPDEIFLSTLIDVAGHAGKVEAAFDILEDARMMGIQLGSVSYSSLMGACCNAKNWQKALELYEDTKVINLLPTVSMLNALMTSLCDGDQLLKSVEVLDEIKKLGVRPNVITYCILIVACEKKAKAELGFVLLSQAKKDGILPNLIICRCLTGLCLQSFEKAYSLGESVVTFNSGRPQIESEWTSSAIMVYRQTIAAGVIPTIEVFSQVLGCLQFPHDLSLKNSFVENLGINFDASRCSNISSFLDGFGEYDTRCFSILEEAVSLGVVQRVSVKENPILVDARKLQIHVVEVYLLTILKGLKHRLAAGARLPNITILLPIEKTVIQSTNGERTINLVGRVGQAVGSLLRRLGLYYQGGESFGRIRINGLTLRRWFKPKLTTSSVGEMVPSPERLAKGISGQQRSIRSRNNLSIE